MADGDDNDDGEGDDDGAPRRCVRRRILCVAFILPGWLGAGVGICCRTRAGIYVGVCVNGWVESRAEFHLSFFIAFFLVLFMAVKRTK